MSWNPFKKQQEPDQPASQLQPDQPLHDDDDPTNPLVEAGSLEERALVLSRGSDKVVFERVELWDNGGLSSLFLRISITDQGNQADTLSKLWLDLPERNTGFCDLLVNEHAALSAKFNYPNSLQANSTGVGQAGGISLRPIELVGGLQALAHLLAQIHHESGWVWPTPAKSGFGWNTAPGIAPGLDCNTLQFIAWDELGDGAETEAAVALVAMVTPAFIELATQASMAGFTFGLDHLNQLIEVLVEAVVDPQLTYQALANKLATLQHSYQLHGLTDVGSKREHNEDAFLLLDLDQTSGSGSKFALAAIADGMGGHKSGEVASNLSLSLLRHYLLGGLLAPSSKPVDSSQLRSQLETVIPSIDRALTERAAMDPALGGMGTTLVGLATLMPQSTLAGKGKQTTAAACVFWVGDSRAYLLGPQGITALTKDHSHVQDLLDAGSISAEESRKHQMKNVITRCLGGSATADGTPDVEWFTPGIGELVLLCSDGLSDVLDDQQIYDVVLGCVGKSLDDIAQALIDAANAGGGPDNITVVLVG